MANIPPVSQIIGSPWAFKLLVLRRSGIARVITDTLAFGIVAGPIRPAYWQPM
jgi:hypothetical protein